MYVRLYSFFYGTFTCASIYSLDSVRRSAHFTRVGVALTNVMDSIVHILQKKLKKSPELEREAEEIKEKAGNWREKPDRMSRNYKKATLEVRII